MRINMDLLKVADDEATTKSPTTNINDKMDHKYKHQSITNVNVTIRTGAQTLQNINSKKVNAENKNALPCIHSSQSPQRWQIVVAKKCSVHAVSFD